ncbi:MAG: hypothetical protein K2I90_03480 [Odoribacter sp.]|nr:hypothetical protein [Odoribacter sp.]
MTIADAEIYDDHANVNFSIAWENSWRDDFNWDAVYVFLKCRKKEGDKKWQHVRLRPDYHTVSNGYTYVLANSAITGWNPGVFIYRSRNGAGDAAVDITLQWDYVKNGYTKSDFTLRQLEYTAMCIEMVYVPNGSFYAGDNYSEQTFKAAYQPIWEQYDLVKIDGKNTFESDLIAPRVGRLANPPSNAANHVNMNGTSTENAWISGRADGLGYWQVAFPDAVTVRYFGISAVANSGIPTSFALFGKNKNDAAWTGPIYEGTKDDWLRGPADSYPVSKSLKVKEPGSYSDYLIRFYGAAVAINNISMTDKDLSQSTDFAYLVDNAGTTIPLSNTGRGLYADDKQTWSGDLAAAYPSGFYGFYVMKYELSQDQYVRFLNKLTLAQQKARTIGEDLMNVPEGGYVFGNSHTKPEARNGIVVSTKPTDGSPLVFANKLNVESSSFSQSDDGLTIACNYMNPYDMLAYADWSGLRPMSELEFEKAAREAYPTTPELGEYAWNSGDYTTVMNEGTLKNAGTPSEYLEGANINVNKTLDGPVRCGSFAAKNGSRTEAGASYWGVMELSGNLAEICYNVNPDGRGFVGTALAHGDGSIKDNGTTDMDSKWPQGLNAFALRGGSFATTSLMARISDRTKAWTGYSNLSFRDSTVTFRLAHSAGSLQTTPVTTYLTLQNGQTSLNGGRDTVCAGSTYVIKGSDLLSSTSVAATGVRKDVKKAFDGRCEYIWYISENNGGTWNVIQGARDRDLTYEKFANDGSNAHPVLVRRMMITPEYVSMSASVTLNVVNVTYVQYQKSDTLRADNSAIGCLIETVTPSQYIWRWKGQGFNTAPLRTSPAGQTSDFYVPHREHFNNVSGVTYPVECEIKMLKCTRKVELSVYVQPRNEKKVISSNEVALNSDDPAKRCGVLMMNPLDGEVYGTVKIGNQCWMSENVRTAIPGSSYLQPGDGNPKIEKGYFYARNDAVKNTVCRIGWRMQTSADFQELKDFLNRDGNASAGMKLKAGNNWSVTKGNLLYQGTNSSGFSAYGAGYYSNQYVGQYAYFVTSDDRYWRLSVNNVDFLNDGGWGSYIMNIRCIRNAN